MRCTFSTSPTWHLLLLTLFVQSSVLAQDPDSINLAQLIFGPAPFPELAQHVTGEYDGKPNGTDLQAHIKRSYLLLESTTNSAVVAMEMRDEQGKGADAYLFFERDSVWKMSAMRGLAMTGLIDMMQQELSRLTDKQVKKIIKEAASDTLGIGLFKSREEYEFMLGNTSLTIALDADIIRHFEEHRAEFERIKDVAIADLQRAPHEPERGHRLATSEEAAYRRLFITSVSTSYELGDVIDFTIGGMVDNTVGYCYARTHEAVPEMDASRIIMVRAIGNGWYIYKTT